MIDGQTTQNVDDDDKFQNIKNEEDEPQQTRCQILMQFVKENTISGVTVALVSIPLSFSLAITSGTNPIMGFQAAIYGSILQGIFGGSQFNILGPTGATSNIIMNIVNDNGIKVVPIVTIVAGIIQFLFFVLKLEKICLFIPRSVLEGFSWGVAITIGFSQLDSAFGIYDLNLRKNTLLDAYEIIKNIRKYSKDDFLTFLIFFSVLMFLQKFVPGKPWIIAISFFGIALGWLSIYFDEYFQQHNLLQPTLLKQRYPNMNFSSEYIHYRELVNFDYLQSDISYKNILISSLKVSIVSILETLTSARIASKLTNLKYNQSQEVFGLSISNIVCGALGGLPCSSTLLRTTVNLASGASSKLSQLLSGFIIFTVIVILLPIFSYMPMPVVASILITMACRLLPSNYIDEISVLDKFELFVLLMTTILCVTIDGATGLIIGGLICLIVYAFKQSKPGFYYRVDHLLGETILIVKIQGSLNYLNCLTFEKLVIQTIEDQKPFYMIIEFEYLDFIDVDAVKSIQSILDFRDNILSVLLISESQEKVGQIEKQLVQSPFFNTESKENLIFYKYQDVLKELTNQSQNMMGSKTPSFLQNFSYNESFTKI